MTKRDDISHELKQLSSQLGDSVYQPDYQVPAGYFDEFSSRLLKRIKALDAADAGTELNELSPLLGSISKKTPYAAPAGYFEQLEATSQPEEMLSPLLASLKETNPYSVPKGYFEKLPSTMATRVNRQPAKVFSLPARKWVRYAVAALLIGFVGTIGLLVVNQNSQSDNPTAQVKKSLRKVSTNEINLFIEQTGLTGHEVVKTETKNEIKDLLKDVSDKEIQDFLDDAQPAADDADDDLLLN